LSKNIDLFGLAGLQNEFDGLSLEVESYTSAFNDKTYSEEVSDRTRNLSVKIMDYASLRKQWAKLLIRVGETENPESLKSQVLKSTYEFEYNVKRDIGNIFDVFSEKLQKFILSQSNENFSSAKEVLVMLTDAIAGSDNKSYYDPLFKPYYNQVNDLLNADQEMKKLDVKVSVLVKEIIKNIADVEVLIDANVLAPLKMAADKETKKASDFMLYGGVGLSAFVLFLSLLVLKKINAGVSKTLQSLEGIAGGDLTVKYDIDLEKNDEISKLSQAVQLTSASLASIISRTVRVGTELNDVS
jgi:methyl-accepting chemotaxis protein